MAIEIPSGALSESEGPSVAERIGGGLVVGLHRDPIIGRALDELNKRFVGADPAVFEQLESRLEGSRLSDVAELVGEYGPQLIAGAGAYSLGRVALTSAMRAAAPRLAAAGAGRVATQFGLIAAKMAETAETLTPLAKPGLLRATELVGGALGAGAFSGTQTAAAGGDWTDVAKSAAIGSALSAGIEGGLIGLGKLVSPAAREISFTKPLERAQILAQGQVRSLAARSGQITQARNQIDKLNVLLETAESADDWEKAFRRKGWLERAVAARSGRLEAVKDFLKFEEIPVASILREEPAKIGRESAHEIAEDIFTKVIQTPAGLGHKLGVTGVRLLQLGKEAEADAFAAVRMNTALFEKFARRVADARGIRLPRHLEGHLDKLDDVLRGPWDLAERRVGGGLAAVRVQYGDEVANAFSDLSDDLLKIYKPLADRGAAPLLRPDELGDGIYLPHVIADRSSEEIEKRMIAGLVKQGMAPGAAQARVANILSREREGVVQFGSIDHRREVLGTLAEKTAAGMPFDGPASGLLRYLNATATRLAYAQRFGINNEIRPVIVGLAAKEGASPNLTANLFDHLVGAKYHPRAIRRAAQSITSLQSGVKLTFAPVANMFQGANNAIVTGTKNAARGAWTALRGGDPSLSPKLASILETEFEAMNRINAGVADANVLDRFARGALRLSGFSMSERFNRVSGAGSTIYHIEDTFAKAAAGRLRGNTLDAARRRMAALHIDLGKVTRKLTELKETAPGGNSLIEAAVDAVHGAGTYDRAVFFGTRISQFIPTRSSTPFLWATPFGRVLFQFKNYALQQGILIRDQVIAEAARGNLKPLATFAGFYPLAGEAIGTTLAALKDRDRPTDGLTRLVEDLSMVGGFGLVQSMVLAAQYGRMQDFFLGPTVTDAMAVGEAILQANTDRLAQQLLRQPLAVATKRLAEGSAYGLDQLLEYADLDGGSNDYAIPYQELK